MFGQSDCVLAESHLSKTHPILYITIRNQHQSLQVLVLMLLWLLSDQDQLASHAMHAKRKNLLSRRTFIASFPLKDKLWDIESCVKQPYRLIDLPLPKSNFAEDYLLRRSPQIHSSLRTRTATAPTSEWGWVVSLGQTWENNEGPVPRLSSIFVQPRSDPLAAQPPPLNPTSHSFTEPSEDLPFHLKNHNLILSSTSIVQTARLGSAPISVSSKLVMSIFAKIELDRD